MKASLQTSGVWRQMIKALLGTLYEEEELWTLNLTSFGSYLWTRESEKMPLNDVEWEMELLANIEMLQSSPVKIFWPCQKLRVSKRNWVRKFKTDHVVRVRPRIIYSSFIWWPGIQLARRTWVVGSTLSATIEIMLNVAPSDVE